MHATALGRTGIVRYQHSFPPMDRMGRRRGVGVMGLDAGRLGNAHCLGAAGTDARRGRGDTVHGCGRDRNGGGDGAAGPSQVAVTGGDPNTIGSTDSYGGRLVRSEIHAGSCHSARLTGREPSCGWDAPAGCSCALAWRGRSSDYPIRSAMCHAGVRKT